MRRSLLLAALFFVCPFVGGAEPVTEIHFGTSVPDPYRWLEKADAPDVQSWVAAQNQAAQKYLLALPDRSALAARLGQLSAEQTISELKSRGERLFYLKIGAGHEQACLCWKNGRGDKERVLFDPNSVVSAPPVLQQWFPSPDGRWVAYALHPMNGTHGTLHVMSVDNRRENTAEEINWADFADLAWRTDSRGFYYSRIPSTPGLSESEQVKHMDIAWHLLGASSQADPSVYPESGDPEVYLSPSVPSLGHWLFVSEIHGWTSTNVYFREESNSRGTFVPLFISTCARATVTASSDRIFLLTDEGASATHVLSARAHGRDKSDWTEWVPSRPGRVLSDLRVVGDSLVLVASEHVADELLVFDPEGKEKRAVAFPTASSIQDIDDGNGAALCFQRETFFQPPAPSCLEKDLKTLRSASEAAPVDPGHFSAELVWFNSKDQTPVSMYILRASSLTAGADIPFELDLYGGFGVSFTPHYRPDIRALLERGWGVAVPHLRGGGEQGEAWHRQGMLTRKQATFDDGLAAADYLFTEKWTDKNKLVARGGSNGGLTVGALITQRPDFFRAAVCKVPILDMVRYPLFGEGRTWLPEFGSPDKEDEFRALLAYSPYHHVTPGAAYPGVLFLSSDSDQRVDPLHARKMTAALQAASSSGRPILLLTRSKAGHGGSGFVSTNIDDAVNVISFMEAQVRPIQP